MHTTLNRGAIGLAALATLAGAAGLALREPTPSLVLPVDEAPTAPLHGVAQDLRSDEIRKPWSYIPPQCYTRTDGEEAPRNPCYACHQDSRAPNFLDDAAAQLVWSFAEPAVDNPWDNLFRDRRAAAAAISDAEIDAYVRADNYRDADGGITLARVLAELPEGWDVDGDGAWGGYVPDCHFDFDEAGYDRGPDGQKSGWRVFAYYPFLGTFFPTNGATDDVMIRLPPAFRQRDDGAEDARIYEANLAIIEAIIRQSDLPIPPSDEAAIGLDLDGDGALGVATRVRYRDPHGDEAPLRYVGRAAAALREGRVHIGAGRYPEGTEFLHSVRYLRVDDDGAVGMAPRMKELRYMVKTHFLDTHQLQSAVLEEALERRRFPERLRTVVGDVERGVATGQGFRMQGFIEDAYGALRPQTLEESATCIGCHSGIGATSDGTFAFPRRLSREAYRGGWYHPSERGYEGLADPARADGAGEYATYLRAVGGGDEFRANEEVRARFFDDEGAPRAEAFERLATDLSWLLLPSPERARDLNRAYRVTVREQSYWRGRDALVTPVARVHERVELDGATGITEALTGPGPRLGLP